MDGIGDIANLIVSLMMQFLPLILVGVMVYYMSMLFFRRRAVATAQAKTGAGGGKISLKGDAEALVLDFNNYTYDVVSLYKLSENIYMSGEDVPRFVIAISPSFRPKEIPRSRVARYCIDPFKPLYIAVGRDIILQPMDMELSSALTALEKGGLIELDKEDLNSLIIQLLKLEQGKKGKFTIAPTIKLGFTIDQPKLVMKFSEEILLRASKTLKVLFSNLAEWERMTEYIKALTEYARTRYGWMGTLITLMLVMGIVLVMLKMFHVI